MRELGKRGEERGDTSTLVQHETDTPSPPSTGPVVAASLAWFTLSGVWQWVHADVVVVPVDFGFAVAAVWYG
jgi:hypothetical protein